MVTRVSKSFSEESNLVSAEVLIKCSSNSNFSLCLCSTFWRGSLDQSHEEVENLWIVENLSGLPADVSEHKVSLLVLEWVVKTIFGDIVEALHERINLFERSVGELYHIFSSHRINESSIAGGLVPLSTDKIHALVFR